MHQQIPFRKCHGIGNDFILFDGLTHSLPIEMLMRPRLVVSLCDRHCGIGADGVLLLLPPSHKGTHAIMYILNSDGSEAQMCGNGIRCIAKVLKEQGQTLPSTLDRVVIETKAGLRSCDLQIGEGGKVNAVKVEMGQPNFERGSLPMMGEGPFVDSVIQVSGREFRATAVSVGNPHLIIFIEDEQDLRSLAETYGPALEHHPLFPQRTNVEFVRRRGDAWELWVWERGCGITLACGTGACATAAAAVFTQRSEPGQMLAIHLPGGILKITVAQDLSQIWMEGPVVEVFQGVLNLDDQMRNI